jgi:hypothetical protein
MGPLLGIINFYLAVRNLKLLPDAETEIFSAVLVVGASARRVNECSGGKVGGRRIC